MRALRSAVHKRSVFLGRFYCLPTIYVPSNMWLWD